MRNIDKYIYCLIFLVFTLNSCNISSKYDENKKTDSAIIIKAQTKILTAENPDTINFFKDCEKLMKRSWQGGLQGTNRSRDSVGYLCFSACYDCHETYEMIFVYKGGVERRKLLGYDSIRSSFKSGCNNSFKDFDCFVFVIPMKDPEKQDDIHKTRYTFPSKVKIYKLVDSANWKPLEITSVNNFQAYGDLRFKTIYGMY
jgi:hypothetical protein